jgi:quercetin dioxygenase-like cupin family protein
MQGSCDVALDGKLYHLEKDDIIVIPPNMKRGTYISSDGCQTIEIFSPPRQDYIAKLKAVRKGLKG